MSPEVLIYIQNVKNFFRKNEEARNYFLSNVNEELFFKNVAEISQKNFEESGEVMLTKEQFEILKKTMTDITITIKTEDENIENKIYFKVKGFDGICLN